MDRRKENTFIYRRALRNAVGFIMFLMFVLPPAASAQVFAIAAPDSPTAEASLVIGAQEMAKNTSYDITNSCNFSVPASSTGYIHGTSALNDGRLDTYMRLPENGALYWKCSLRSARAQGIYIQWEYPPGEWTFEAHDGDDSVLCKNICGKNDFLQEYIPLPEGTLSFYIYQHIDCERPLSILEISVWSKGRLPESVHQWDLMPTKCELMVISTHQDDELLFFGGVIPYYAGEKKLDTAVVYMANCGSDRLHEALNGLWVCGLRQYPVFLMLPDIKSYSIDEARRTWNDDTVIDMVTELFLEYQPQVVVTHDVNGEYGHGQHMLTAYCVQRALERSADSSYADKIVSGSDAYKVPKCYLHLWEQNKLRMEWDLIELDSMGMTAAQAASAGYGEHVSQHRSYDDIFINGEYDCRDFGLYHSYVGKDRRHNDMFENIGPRIENPESIPLPPDDNFSVCTNSGYVYSDLSSDGEPVYIRYGAVGKTEDWYICDETGALTMADGSAVSYDGITELSDGKGPKSEYVARLYTVLWDKIRVSRIFTIVKADSGLDDTWTAIFLGGGMIVFLVSSMIILSFITALCRKLKKKRSDEI